ncbi:MAG: hypothetical protein GC202_13745 [Alphaproteobacteria bacterium]|nr:hypothetical protein [Alphaproteobacteria bacterium]
MAIVRTFPRTRPAAAHGEPRLSELLDDPVTQAVMRRDGVTRDGILAMFGNLQPCITAPAGCGCA